MEGRRLQDPDCADVYCDLWGFEPEAVETVETQQ